MTAQVRTVLISLTLMLAAALAIQSSLRAQKIAELESGLEAERAKAQIADIKLKNALAAQARMQTQLEQWQAQSRAAQQALETALQTQPQWANQKLPDNIRKAVKP
nr:hypothetical protein [uncultured Kingella sp.]